jgi:hypothetical protein
MVIRDVRPGAGGAGAPNAPTAGGFPRDLEKSITSTGVLQPGQTPKQAAQELLLSLQGAGFGAGLKGELSIALAGALRSFQGAEGLPKSGKLDQPTADALKTAGLAGPQEPPPPPEKGLSKKDGFERAATNIASEKPRVADGSKSTPDTNFLDALLQKLGGDQGVTSDKQGFVGGTAQTATQNTDQVSQAESKKNVDGGEQKKGTTETQKDAREVKQQLAEQAQAQKVQVARGLRTQETKTDERKRKDALTGKDPTQPGILDEEAEEDATEGEGGGGGRKGRGGDNDGGHDQNGTSEGGTGVGTSDGNERHVGNAPSGRATPWDPRRGHASTDDGSGADAGHYLVPSLSEQAFAALELIRMNANTDLRTTTYAWDVTFYKPGTYAPGQMAQELVHLVVERASAFDDVWVEAQDKLRILVHRHEKGAAVPQQADIDAALRQARARG